MSSKSAEDTLIYYFKTIFKAAGLQWDSDNDAEIRSVVEGIVDASSCSCSHNNGRRV